MTTPITITLPGPPVAYAVEPARPFLDALRAEQPTHAGRIIRAMETALPTRPAVDTGGAVAEVVSRVSCFDVIMKRGAGRKALCALRQFAFEHGVLLKCGCGAHHGSFGMLATSAERTTRATRQPVTTHRGPALQWAHANADTRAPVLALLDEHARDERRAATLARMADDIESAQAHEGRAMGLEAAAAVLRVPSLRPKYDALRGELMRAGQTEALTVLDKWAARE